MLVLHSPVEGFVAFTVQDPGRGDGQWKRLPIKQILQWEISTNHHDAWLVDPVYHKYLRTAPSWRRPEQTAGNAKLHLDLRWGRFCEWGLFLPLSNVVIEVVLYLTVEVRWNETQFLLGRAVVEEQPFTLPKGVERLKRGHMVGLRRYLKWTGWLSLEADHLTQLHAILNLVHMEPLWWEEVLTVLSLSRDE